MYAAAIKGNAANVTILKAKYCWCSRTCCKAHAVQLEALGLAAAAPLELVLHGQGHGHEDLLHAAATTCITGHAVASAAGLMAETLRGCTVQKCGATGWVDGSVATSWRALT